MSMEETRARKAEIKTEFWKHHIESCQNSCLTQAQYCKDNGLALATFCYWKKKLSLTRQSKARFYPLAVQPEKVMSGSRYCSSGVSLHLCNEKFRIEVAENFSAATLKQLISVLEQS